MKSETHFRNHLVTVPRRQYHMYLKVVPFNLALVTILGNQNRNDAGRLLGLEGKTIDRGREGGNVSERFMANCIAVFKLYRDRLEPVGLEMTADQFFEERAAEMQAEDFVQAVA